MAEEKKTTEEVVEETNEEVVENESAEETPDTVVEETTNEEIKAENGEAAEDSKKKKKEKKDSKDQKIEELTDKVMRQMAEFENFRRRSEQEKNQMYEIGAKSILEKIVPVVDNFERGLAAVPEDSEDPIAQGMQMIYKQLMASLEEAGVSAIDEVKVEFNPDIHNAVMHVEDEEFGENEVAEVLQKGYKYRDSIVRHAMVKVAN